MENTNYKLSARNTRNSYIKMAVPALLLGLPFLVPAVAFCTTDWKILGTVALSAAGAFFVALAAVNLNKAFWWHKNGARRLEVLAAERDALAQKDEEIARLKNELNKAFWWRKNGARRLETLTAERDALAQKDEEIARLNKELNKHQWVPIHNRMPGLGDEVLASDGNSVYLDSFLENENGQYRMENPRTLYWMELPGLPK